MDCSVRMCSTWVRLFWGLLERVNGCRVLNPVPYLLNKTRYLKQIIYFKSWPNKQHELFGMQIYFAVWFCWTHQFHTRCWFFVWFLLTGTHRESHALHFRWIRNWQELPGWKIIPHTVHEIYSALSEFFHHGTHFICASVPTAVVRDPPVSLANKTSLC